MTSLIVNEDKFENAINALTVYRASNKSDKMLAFNTLANSLFSVYGVAVDDMPILTHDGNTNGDSLRSTYRPLINEISLSGKLSLVTTLTMVGYALSANQLIGEPRLWALRLHTSVYADMWQANKFCLIDGIVRNNE